MKVFLTKKTRYGNRTPMIIDGTMRLRQGIVYEPQRTFQDAVYNRSLFYPHFCVGFLTRKKTRMLVSWDILPTTCRNTRGWSRRGDTSAKVAVA